jgi:hypothetical protein
MDLSHHNLLKRRAMPADLFEDLFGPNVPENPAPGIQGLLVYRETMLCCIPLRVLQKLRAGNNRREGPGRGGGLDTDEAESCAGFSGKDEREIHDFLNPAGAQ